MNHFSQISTYTLRLFALITFLFLLSSCASYTSTPPVDNEGGIVGTGKDIDCKDRQDKTRCNENVK